MLRGDRLRALRLSKQYTHEEMAELLDVNVRQIARYENGQTDPASHIVTRIASVLNVSSDYLLGLSDDPIPHLQIDNLSQREKEVLAAMRRGDDMEAIRRLTEKNQVAAAGD